MERRKNRKRESRQARIKHLGQQESDYQSRLRAKGDLDTSWKQSKDGNMMEDEDETRPRPRAPGISTQDDYVQRWLAQTVPEVVRPSNAELGSKMENYLRFVGQEGLSRGLDFEQFLQGRMYDPQKERTSAKSNPCKRMLESSSNCSFLECALPSDSHHKTLETGNVHEKCEGQKEAKTRRQRRKLDRSISLEGSAVYLSIKPQVESFEKRRRHKTREDRYESKRALVDPKPQVNKQKESEKKEKSKSHRKDPRSGAKGLMYQFSSKNVGLERLTMRPSRNVGLFKNGRASSPGRRRGLPDLAFSEMRFLRRSKQRPVEMEESRSLSKSQDKEKRRSERAQNEISEYFKPSRTLRDDVEQYDRQQVSYTSSADQKLCQAEPLKDRHQSSNSKSTSQSIDFPKEPLLELHRRHAFEQLAPTSHSRGQMVQPAVAPNTVKNFSDRVTSYYTWSDSVKSPEVSKRNGKVCSDISTTPESIRRMLNDTGIFANTGIDRSISQPNEIVGRKPSGSHSHTQPQRPYNISNDTSSTTHLRKSSHIDIQSRRPFDGGEMCISRNHRVHQEEQRRDLDKCVNSGAKSGYILSTTKPVLQHYSPRPGWRENPTDDASAIHHVAKGEISNQGISRQIISKEAYVKLAPTILAAALRADDTQNTTMSAETAEAGSTTSHQHLIKQFMHEIRNAKTADHSPALKAGERKPGGITCSVTLNGAKCHADPHIDRRGPLQSTPPVLSDSPPEHQPDAMLIPGAVSVLSGTLVAAPNLPTTNHQIKGGLDQNRGTRLEGQINSTAPASTSEGPPMRGTWPSRSGRAVSASHAAFAPITVEPLYNYQLQNSISHDLANQIYEGGDQNGQLLDRYDNPLIEYSNDLEDGLYDTFEGECELLDSTQILPQYDIMFPERLDTRAFMVQEPEEDGNTLYQEATLQAMPEQHSFERAQSVGPLYLQHLQVTDPNFDREARPYHPSRNSFHELVREEYGGGYHELTRFWLPRRQY